MLITDILKNLTLTINEVSGESLSVAINFLYLQSIPVFSASILIAISNQIQLKQVQKIKIGIRFST